MRRSLAVCLWVGVALGTSACLEELTREEANEAVASANLASETQALTYDIVEVSTHFTLGKAVREAAEELRAFAASQIPCSTVTLDGASVTIDFGELSDNCTYHGRSYAGSVTISVERSSGDLHVQHHWQGFTNGSVTVDGDADVTWSASARSRHVEYRATSTHKLREERLHSQGVVTQSLIDEELGMAGGIEINGRREWYLEGGGGWMLDIESVEARAQDPVPQAGRCVLTTPSDKTATLEFERFSDSTIRVTVTGPRGRRHEFDVISLE